jgi:hypothetical protein
MLESRGIAANERWASSYEIENWDLVVLTFEGHIVPKEIPYSDFVFQGCLKVDIVKIGEGKEFLDIKNDEKNLVLSLENNFIGFVVFKRMAMIFKTSYL